jgi:hypothetical protein
MARSRDSAASAAVRSDFQLVPVRSDSAAHHRRQSRGRVPVEVMRISNDLLAVADVL